MNELLRASFMRTVTRCLPRRLRHRAARCLYDYESGSVRGVDVVVDYADDLGLKFLLNTKDLIGWNIFVHGAYERETNRLLREHVKPDDVVVEVGANNGSETMLLGRLVGPAGRVHAFEPVPHVRQQLAVNVMLNELERQVCLCALALGEKEGEVVLHLMPRSAPNQGMSSKVAFDEAREKLVVPQTTLDRWAAGAGLRRLDLLKMDIQGAELDLLRGGIETLRRFRPILFTEADTLGAYNLSDLWEMFRSLGYRVFNVRPGWLEPLPAPQDLPRGNWIAFHERRDPQRKERA
jgi:FkbM family methyltransferase